MWKVQGCNRFCISRYFKIKKTLFRIILLFLLWMVASRNKSLARAMLACLTTHYAWRHQLLPWWRRCSSQGRGNGEEGVRVTDLKLGSRHKWNESEKTGSDNSCHGTTCFLFTQGKVGDCFGKVMYKCLLWLKEQVQDRVHADVNNGFISAYLLMSLIRFKIKVS